MGVKYIFDQAQYNASNVTAFNKLKAYLVGKVAWKTSYNVEDLTQKYFENVFKVYQRVVARSPCRRNEVSRLAVFYRFNETVHSFAVRLLNFSENSRRFVNLFPHQRFSVIHFVSPE